VIGAVERPLDGPVMGHTHLAPAAVVEGRRHAIGHIAAEEPPSRLQWHRLSQSALGHVVITPCTPTVRSRPTPQGGRRSIRTDGLSIFSPAPCDKALLTTPGTRPSCFPTRRLCPTVQHRWIGRRWQEHDLNMIARYEPPVDGSA